MKILEDASYDEVRARYIELGGLTPERFIEDRDAAQAALDALQAKYDALRLSTGLLQSIAPCEPSQHEWSPCTRSPVTVCLKCGDRIDGSAAR